MQKKAKIKDILVWYRPILNLSVWFTEPKHKSIFIKDIDETWYGGFVFTRGYFVRLNLYVKSINIDIRIWKLKNPFRK